MGICFRFHIRKPKENVNEKNLHDVDICLSLFGLCIQSRAHSFIYYQRFFCLLYCKTGYLVKTIHLTVDIFENFHSSRLLSIVTFPNEFKWIAWYSKVFRGHCK